MSATKYPLAWPTGWPRTPAAKRLDSKYRFKRLVRVDFDPVTGNGASAKSAFWTFAEARDDLIDEMKRLKASHVVLSSNFPLTSYGVPREDKRRPDDQGVAIYFLLKGREKVMACDMHVRAEENMRSLSLAIQAMRQLERHGGGVMMDRAFEGFQALPAPGFWDVLGIAPTSDRETISAAYRAKAKVVHPDIPGGSHEAMTRLRAAYDSILEGLDATCL